MGRSIQPDPAVPFFITSGNDIVVPFLFLIAELADSVVAKVSGLDESFPADSLDECRC
jgi:hypothetical protein